MSPFPRILSRLTSKDPDAIAGRSPLPPPGPFVTPTLGQQLSGIQPKFAALHQPGKMSSMFADVSDPSSSSDAPPEKKPAMEETVTSKSAVDEETPMDLSAPAQAPVADKPEEKAENTQEVTTE
ncbi:hypothetical protein COOONC_05750 [Cooperia oncophora]